MSGINELVKPSASDFFTAAKVLRFLQYTLVDSYNRYPNNETLLDLKASQRSLHTIEFYTPLEFCKVRGKMVMYKDLFNDLYDSKYFKK